MLSVCTTLFVPASSPKRILDAGLFGADCVLFDLEDAVLEGQKEDARYVIRHFVGSGLCTYRWGVRVNHIHSPYFRDDLKAIVPLKPFVVELPKAESADDVLALSDILEEIESNSGFPPGEIRISPAIESPAALMRAFEIAASCKRVATVPFGAEDYLTAVGGRRTESRVEIDYARKRFVTEVAAAGKAAIDAPFTDVEDLRGLLEEAEYARDLGYAGKDSVAPSQIAVIKKAFAPRESEIRYARRIVDAMKEAEGSGIGALALDGQMLDAPLLASAKRTLTMTGELDLGEGTGR